MIQNPFRATAVMEVAKVFVSAVPRCKEVEGLTNIKRLSKAAFFFALEAAFQAVSARFASPADGRSQSAGAASCNIKRRVPSLSGSRVSRA